MTDLEAFHMQAFVDFMRAVPNIDGLLKQFETDSGMKVATQSPIEMMVDEASGYDKRRFHIYVNWCADQYGRDFLPHVIFEALRAQTIPHQKGN